MADTNIQKKEQENVEQVERTRSGRCYIPATDIIEKEETILLLADMPGADKNAIDITLEDNVLTIQGCVEEKDPEGARLLHSEYGVGDYHRSFTLNDTIDQSKIKASFSTGVLRLELPKAEKAKTRKIDIKS